MYYTEMFSGNMAKTSVFDNLGCPGSVCFPFTEQGLYEHQTFFLVHTQNGI